MKLTSSKMTKRLTLLLAVVFSWLFIGSLIIFHQEHVLGKHVNAISHQFIVPKSKEKTGHYLNQQPTSHKVTIFAGIVAVNQETQEYFIPGIIEKLAISPLGLFSDHPPRMGLGLRAPPVA